MHHAVNPNSAEAELSNATRKRRDDEGSDAGHRERGQRAGQPGRRRARIATAAATATPKVAPRRRRSMVGRSMRASIAMPARNLAESEERSADFEWTGVKPPHRVA
jgi:hypothetical protein